MKKLSLSLLTSALLCSTALAQGLGQPGSAYAPDPTGQSSAIQLNGNNTQTPGPSLLSQLSFTGTGFPTMACSTGQVFLATDTNQIWDCTDNATVWTNRVTGVTSSGAAPYNTGLLARYDSANCTSTTLPDSSDNGNTGTFATGSGSLYGAAPTCSSGTGVVFNGSYTAGSPPNYLSVQFISLPNAAVNGSQTDIVYYLPASGGGAPSNFSQTIFWVAGTENFGITLRAGDNAPTDGADGIPYHIGTSQQWKGVTPLVFSHCNATSAFYYQGTQVNGYNYTPVSAPAFASVTEAEIGTIVGPYIGPFVGTHYYQEHYSSCLTKAQINTETARINALLSGRGIALGNTLNTSAPIVVWDGTSITQGYNLYASYSYSGYNGGTASYFGLSRSSFGSSIQMINNGVSGQNLATAILKLQSADLSQTTGRLAPVVILDYPTNDIQNASSVPTAETNATSACSTIHTAGARCVLTTVLPCTVAACTSNFSANRATWNIWVRANCYTVADACVDAASDPVIGPDSAASSTTYYGDGHHPTLAADAIIAPYYEAAITKLTGIQPLSGPPCVSGASPAVCGSAVAGSVAVPTGTDPTLVIDTTAVTNLNRVLLTIDQSLGTALGVPCNTTLANNAQPWVTARTAGTSFTIEVPATVATNPVCVSWSLSQ